MDIKERELAVRTAVELMDAAHKEIEGADESADLEALERSFDEAKGQHDIAVADLRKAKDVEERKAAVAEAIRSQPLAPVEDTPDVKVTKESLTYERGNEHSVFRDMLVRDRGDRGAIERLNRRAKKKEIDTCGASDHSAIEHRMI